MTGITALLLFVAWTLALMLIYVLPRVVWVLLGQKRANSWTRGGPAEDSPLLVRAGHAHLNCVENLPVFAAVVLAAAVLDRSAVVDTLAPWFLLARVAQSVVHLIGVSHALVFVRGNLFIVQIALLAWMIGGLLV